MTNEPLLETVRNRLGVAVAPLDRANRHLAADVPTVQPHHQPQPAQAAPRMVPNPEATLWGRLSTPRTDVPAMVREDRVPQGLTASQVAPRVGEIGGGVQVRDYVGSMYPGYNAANYARMGPMGDSVAGPGAQGGGGTMLPIGNPSARDALLRLQFPNATREQISGLGAMAYARPGEFNRSMGGTNLDPTMVGLRVASAQQGLATARQNYDESAALAPYRVAGAALGLDAQKQSMILSADEARRRLAGDNYAGAAFGAPGVPSNVVFDVEQAKLARDRMNKPDAKPYETSFHGRPAIVGGGGNVTFTDNVKKEKPEKPTGQPIISDDGRMYWSDGDWKPLRAERDEGLPGANDIIALQLLQKPETLAMWRQLQAERAAKHSPQKPTGAAPAADDKAKKAAKDRFKIVETK